MEDQQNPEFQEDLGSGGKFKNWLQDNIRIIISVLIVVAIAGGIYSYSKRGEVVVSEEEIAIEEKQEGEPLAVVEEETEENDEKANAEKKAEEGEEEAQVVVNQQEEAKIAVSEETAEAFVETAMSGDSKTTLARKALANYLEKNQDSSLTAEHKIYIEDYLRKNIDHAGALHPGNSISFSKMLIQDGIEKAKTLDEHQLENLKKYSERVSSF